MKGRGGGGGRGRRKGRKRWKDCGRVKYINFPYIEAPGEVLTLTAPVRVREDVAEKGRGRGRGRGGVFKI